MPFQRLSRFPRGAIDPLQLRIALVTPPVRGRSPHQLERRNVSRRGHMRSATQVAPDGLAGVRVDVVIDGQLSRADLHDLVRIGAGVRRRPLEVDQLELVRLVRQLPFGLAHRAQDTTRESLAGLDYFAHGLLEDRQVLRGERPVDVEVVVETVGYRRTDAQLGVGKVLLHSLGEHVCARVPDNAAPVGAARCDSVDLGLAVGYPGKVAQGALRIPSDDDGVWTRGGHSAIAQGLPSGRPGRHRHSHGGLDSGRRRDHESSSTIRLWRLDGRSYPGAIQPLARDEACPARGSALRQQRSEHCHRRLGRRLGHRLDGRLDGVADRPDDLPDRRDSIAWRQRRW